MEYRLFRGDVELGTISDIQGDFPGFSGRFTASADFAAVEHLFTREAALGDALNVDVVAWESAYRDAVGPGLSLLPVGRGKPVIELALTIRGSVVSWRE